jgi:hypothetical protein
MNKYVEIEDTYNKDGYWIKSSANGIPLFIPEQDKPSVQIVDFDLRNCEWIMTKKTMTKEEFELSVYSLLDRVVKGKVKKK